MEVKVKVALDRFPGGTSKIVTFNTMTAKFRIDNWLAYLINMG
ncbi:hypothetical protein [Paenibacillus roseipurpureus]|uniref:Uncharacterized protein n=1 Tax=Paenibacillus roseopurpureus TaxID=2918901 RepID=A0AA96RNA3_9BACL|nr:hypothetical protein [Paenibacillus sp. MBLB1832]WNR47164.1 hypothetical protein MJB10_17545 [Paenibacillus sp. MBLB1832]